MPVTKGWGPATAGGGSGNQGGATGATSNALVKATSANTLADTAFFETNTGQLQIGGKTSGYPTLFANGDGNLYVNTFDGGAAAPLASSTYTSTYGVINSTGVGSTNGTALYVSSGANYATLRYVGDGILTMENGTAGPGWIINSAGESYQTADVTKNNNTTVADLTGLSLTLKTGRKYRGEAILFVDSSATGAGAAGIKITLAGTATASAFFASARFEGAAVGNTATSISISGTMASTGITLTDAVNVVRLNFFCVCSGNGTLKLQGAQASGVAANTVFKTDSYFFANDTGL